MATELVVGPLLSASIQVLFERISSWEVIDFFKRKKLSGQLLNKIKMKLSSANIVLNDAEEQQMRNPEVKKWLDELKEVIYNAEYMVDKINNKAMRSKLDGQSASQKVRNFVSAKFTARKIEQKMGEILDRLEYIVRLKDDLGLKEGVQNRPFQRLPATSLLEEYGVYGRNSDKEAIIKLLLSDEISGNKISVIPIVGMGGVGKTTLAQLVYKDIDDRVMNKPFDFKTWVSVSDEFDVFKITKLIAERVTSQIIEVKDLDVLQVTLEEALKGKKFLFILDDVWNEDYFLWEELKKPFKSGEYGSKIIVTTRNESVASVMRNVPSYKLHTMSDENCWELFVRHAFHNEDPCAYPKLDVIGRQIVKKCKGLPLAVKSLGSLLRHQRNPKEWEKILTSDTWELPKEKNNILPALWLSYHYLPSHLKRCFAYCSIFPKDYEINKEDLIKLWMAENLLQPQRNKRIEEVGEEYFDHLLSRSFFQQSLSLDKSVCYVMHDLVIDLATFIVGEFCLRFDDSNLDKVLSKILHVSHVKENILDMNKYESLCGAKRLQTLFLSSKYASPYNYIASKNMVMSKLLPTLPCLRVLSLRRCLIQELPKSIGNLKFLKYLNLSETIIEEMPNTVCTLYNLQTLLLKGCEKLRQLPTNMGRLINLRHLDITSTGLVELPHQIGKLKDLQTLTDFILGKGSTGSTLKELEDLQLLHGILRISRLENVVDVADTLMGNLKDKKFLTELQFFWDSNSEESTENHKDVLNGLQPHTNIKVLQINSYRGEQFPKWVGDNSFCNIEQIHLEGCKKCCFLPPLGQLPFLKKLCIIEFDELVKIGNEFCHAGSSMAKPFRSLEFLKFRHMREWQEWSFIGEDRVVFPNLKELYLEGCPKLTGNLCLLDTIESIRLSGCHNLDFPGIHCYASLKRLKISDSCDSMKSILLDYFPKLNELDLDYCVNLESFEFSQSPRPALHSLRCFKLTTCPKFVSFPQGGLAAPNMDEFHIEDCKNFRSLPENMNTLLPSLQSISLISCPELVSFPECGLPPGINKLKVYWCNKLFTNRFQWDLQRLNSLTFLEIIGIDEELTSFPEEGLFPITLVDLHIRYLPHLKSLNGKALQQLDSLKHLSISCCNELQLLPEEGLPKSLSDLIIFQCAWLERRCQRDTGEDWSKIVHIPRVIFI
ncbi:putative disease resistance protein At3g14460 [Ziziphus jujuba]|uniref:Disease resistance protein At3g14460 n=1 Tax=Ziziphus jujuba TaxID=326968 RepID=A0A6P3ZN43_ZIZJJ|nr:putative disease resistance protein At3g14460 [Ziziphus jujuba]